MNKSNLKKIKEITNERGISLKWLADKAGLSQQAVSAIIKENSTSVNTLIRIADALDVPVTTFFETDYGSDKTYNGIVGGDFMVNSQKEAGLAIQALINQLDEKDKQIHKLIGKLK